MPDAAPSGCNLGAFGQHPGGADDAIEPRRSSPPRAVIAVDPGPLDVLPRAKSVFAGFADQLEGPNAEAVRRAWVDPGPIDPVLRRKVIDTMCAVPLATAIASLRGTTTAWNGTASLALCRVPLMVIVSRLGGRNDPARLLKLKPDVTVGVPVGAGHFHQLAVPQQVNAMIERLLPIAVA